MCLVEPQDNRIFPLGDLDRIENQVWRVERKEVVDRRACPKQRQVEVEGFRDYAAVLPAPLVRIDRVLEPVLPHVRDGIWGLGRAQQADTHLVCEGAVSVLGFGQNGDSETVLRQVGPFLARYFVAGEIVERRVVSRALDGAELNLVGCARAVHVDRESHLEHLLALVPVDRPLELDAL